VYSKELARLCYSKVFTKFGFISHYQYLIILNKQLEGAKDKVTKQNETANDYALARYLDEFAVSIFAFVANYHDDLPDLKDINRSYVLIVNELKQIYARNPELAAISENICWRTFSSIISIDPYTLYEYSDDYRNHGNDHIARVDELCIIAGIERPDIPERLATILNEAKANVKVFAESWLIPQYTFGITPSGLMLVNGLQGLMNVKKVQAGSTTEMILTQAKEREGQLFKPDLGASRNERGIRTTLIEAGFDETLEHLFLPVMDNQRGIKFRSKVSRATAINEGIDLSALDAKLKQFGAKTVFDTFNLPS